MKNCYLKQRNVSLWSSQIGFDKWQINYHKCINFSLCNQSPWKKLSFIRLYLKVFPITFLFNIRKKRCIFCIGQNISNLFQICVRYLGIKISAQYPPQMPLKETSLISDLLSLEYLQFVLLISLHAKWCLLFIIFILSTVRLVSTCKCMCVFPLKIQVRVLKFHI